MPITQHRNAKYWFSLEDIALLLRILDDLELIYEANSDIYVHIFTSFIFCENTVTNVGPN